MRWLQSLRLCLGLVVLTVTVVFSQTGFPLIINYSGTLTGEEAGKSNTVNIKFSLYENEMIAIPIWQEEHVDVSVSNGVFNCDLGSVVPFASTVPFNKQYWLGIVYDGMTEFKIKLTASPYALTANTVSGKILEGVAIENNLLVKSVNGLTDDITLREGTDISITKEGNEIIFSYTGTGGGGGDLTSEPGAIKTENLDTNSVTQDKIADNAVTADKIADNTIDSDKIVNDAVTADEIATGAVGADEIATDAVTADEIATGAVGADEIAT
ncbi:MAG: hypothetical protein OCC49_19065, partial [Fibrobacterales bacterium]